MQFQFHSSIDEINALAWDSLWPTAYPFTRHAFLAALEHSGSIDSPQQQGSGWIPRHLSVTENEELLAVMPLFIKQHSYGEYVFDWSWADAYARNGLDYYPKLVNAIPFTPATGPRIAFHSRLHETAKSAVAEQMLKAIEEFASTHVLSGFHSLFPSAEQHSNFQSRGFALRHGSQFHWFNQNYQNFDQFLETFSSRKRKNVKKERRVAQSHGYTICMQPASDISEEDWHTFYLLYQRTYLKRSGHGGYLGQDFFLQLAHSMPTQVLMASVKDEQELIAGALFFKDEDTLYGRYWGTRIELDQLHFEACYYQGIEYAIANKLKRFDPGAQGEHKIQRGFTPVFTASFHQLFHADFQAAVTHFVQQEFPHTRHYVQECRTSLPFKEGCDQVRADILMPT
ncbi:hypothetical protein TDB9533_04444 [Thalassocella blandensis]|nr:hypothetical protein TDB9533_04444 [Thalassocella blandensis]